MMGGGGAIAPLTPPDAAPDHMYFTRSELKFTG